MKLTFECGSCGNREKNPKLNTDGTEFKCSKCGAWQEFQGMVQMV